MMKRRLRLKMMNRRLRLKMTKRRRRSVMTEKEKKRRSSVDLPEDLLVEILSRVPEASLARLRRTSKGWNALIKEDGRLAKKSMIIMLIDSRVCLASFDLHGIHHKNFVKVTSQFTLKDPLSNYSKQVDIREVFHCDSLLLCTTEDDRLVVWNPCSGETKWIKPRSSYKKLDIYALGKSSCNNYKILRVNHHGSGSVDPCLVEYEIYDFTSNSWSGVGETRDWSIPTSTRRGISVDGNTYWLAFSFSQDSPTRRDFLLSFDFSTERFEHASLPGDHIYYNVYGLSVTREEQKLCLLASRGYEVLDIDVWMATKIESNGAMSWTKFLTVEGDILYGQSFSFCNGMNFLADQDNKVLVCPGKEGNSNSFLRIVGEDKYRQVDHHDAGSKCSLLFSYVPTLVQIQ